MNTIKRKRYLLFSLGCLASMGYVLAEEQELAVGLSPGTDERCQQQIIETATSVELKLRADKPADIDPEVWKEFLRICIESVNRLAKDDVSDSERGSQVGAIVKQILDEAMVRHIGGGIDAQMN